MLHVGVSLGFGNLHEDLSDEAMYQGELRLAERSLELFAEEVVPAVRELGPERSAASAGGA